jgi:hypothetical protein
MAASQFGPVTQNATPAPKQTEQVGGPDPSGNLQPINIDGAGNLLVAVTGAGSGGTSSVDESGFAAGVSAGTPAMGAYQTSPTALTNNQLGIIALDANRNVKVNIVAGSSGNAAASATGAAVPASADYQGFNGPTGNLTGVASENLDYDTGAGSRPQTIMGIALPASGGPVAGGTNTNPVQIGDAGGSLTVDGSVTVTQATASNLKAQVTGAGTAGTADTGVQTIQGIASMTPVQVSQATAASLNATVVGTGTFAAQVTAVGTVADDLTTPGNPVMVGGTAKSFDGTDPGNVSAEDDVTRTITDLQRRLFVNNVHPQYWSYHSDGSHSRPRP